MGSLDRREFLKSGVASGALALAGPEGAPAAPAFALEEVDLAELGRRLQAGKETARSLVDQYLARIEEVDRTGPTLRSVIELNPEARSIADALDRERRSKGARGPLHGLPVLIKDNIATGDGMSTSAGSWALAGVPAPRDAFVVRRLREAGVVILGKTNLSEWANFRSTHSVSGWSARGGQTRNPYALDRSPSGSSSGAGAAAAASLCAVAVGTETDGSIVSPANNCGLCGLKPTLGLVSRTGIVPIAHSQDTAGPMGRTVADVALLLGALAGGDPQDPPTRAAALKGQRDYLKFLDPRGLEGARIGVPRKGLFGQSPAADRLVEAALTDMKRRGAVIVDPADIATVGKVDRSELEVLLHEFKADLARYLEGLGPAAAFKSLADLIRFNAQNQEREMPFFAQELFEQADKKGPLTSPAYREALASNLRLARVQGIDATMDRHKLDVLVAPTSGPASLIDAVNGDYGTPGCSTLPAVAGYPHLTVPAGFVFGLPVGISFFGRAWSEPTLIRIGYAYEQATRHRRPPRFAPTARLPST